jgi:hypothetical protein
VNIEVNEIRKTTKDVYIFPLLLVYALYFILHSEFYHIHICPQPYYSLKQVRDIIKHSSKFAPLKTNPHYNIHNLHP